uniref:Uncharacterized protein n=1 Tax=Rhizophora mucronata TaxID=61149 RepID=A0A2P2L907_RHIMU
MAEKSCVRRLQKEYRALCKVCCSITPLLLLFHTLLHLADNAFHFNIAQGGFLTPVFADNDFFFGDPFNRILRLYQKISWA